MNLCDNITEREMREAFQRSGLWRDGWNYQRAIDTDIVLRGLRMIVAAMQRKEHNGKPAPRQRATP